MPVTPTRGNACAAYTTQRGRAVPTASLASMGRLPDRAVTVSVGMEGVAEVGLPAPALLNQCAHLGWHRLHLQPAGHRSPAVPIH